jgi:hypothetical protein
VGGAVLVLPDFGKGIFLPEGYQQTARPAMFNRWKKPNRRCKFCIKRKLSKDRAELQPVFLRCLRALAAEPIPEIRVNPPKPLAASPAPRRESGAGGHARKSRQPIAWRPSPAPGGLPAKRSPQARSVRPGGFHKPFLTQAKQPIRIHSHADFARNQLFSA